jgi:hypothetical protein
LEEWGSCSWPLRPRLVVIKLSSKKVPLYTHQCVGGCGAVHKKATRPECEGCTASRKERTENPYQYERPFINTYGDYTLDVLLFSLKAMFKHCCDFDEQGIALYYVGRNRLDAHSKQRSLVVLAHGCVRHVVGFEKFIEACVLHGCRGRHMNFPLKFCSGLTAPKLKKIQSIS